MITYKSCTKPASSREDIIFNGKKIGDMDIIDGKYRAHIWFDDVTTDCFGYGIHKEGAIENAILKGTSDAITLIANLDALVGEL